MTETTHPRRRWASALIATTVAVPLLLGGAATAAWAATDETPVIADLVETPAADATPDAEILPDPEDVPAEEPTAGAPVAVAAGAGDPQPASTNDPQALTLTVTTPELEWLWYDEHIVVGIQTQSRIGAGTTIEWSMTGAQVGSGQAAGPRVTLPITGNGVTRVTISAFDDEGNAAGPVSQTIRIDTTVPVVTVASPIKPVYRLGETAEVDVICEDPESGYDSCIFSHNQYQYDDGETVTFNTLGTFKVSGYARNGAFNGGHSLERSLRVIEDEDDLPIVDIQAPPANGGWWNAPVKVTLVGDDGTGSGVEHLEYRTFDDGVPGPWQTLPGATGSFQTSGDGDNRYQVRAVDWFGNVGIAETVSFPTDATAPVVTVSLPADGITVEPGEELALEYTCDDALSGVVSCEAPVADGDLLDTRELGTFEVVVRAVDEAGNVTSVVRRYTVAEPDETGPVVEFETRAAEASGWFFSASDVTVTAADAAGVATISWEIEAPDGSIERGASTDVRSVVLPADRFGEGVWTVRATAVDELGNSTDAEFTVRIDGAAPVVTIDSPANAPALVAAVEEFEQGDEIALEFTCTDAVSGIDSCESSVGDALPTSTLGTFTVEVVAIDAAGHRSAQSLQYTVVAADGPAPTPVQVRTLAQTGSSTALLTAALALGMLLVGAAAAGSVILVRRGR